MFLAYVWTVKTLVSISTWHNFMNIWNIRKVREENVLSGLLNTYEKKDFENFVTDFTPGFFRGKGQKRAKRGVSRHEFTNSRTTLAFKV